MKEIPDLISELSPLEKTLLVEGSDSWYTNAPAGYEIPRICMTDGPHGLRMAHKSRGGFAVSDNIKATAFPTAAAVASSWDPGNAWLIGRAIAAECIEAGVDIILAPGVNIKRSPLCGRNFEYYSEDPLVSGLFGASFVEGVQSLGVGACVKHFAANSCENYRFTGDSIMDERALREIYLKAFEIIIRKSQPYAVMCSYNKLNGIPLSENFRLLTGILREEWGFDGTVMTDWGAAVDRAKGISAGCDLDMPGETIHNRKVLIESLGNGSLGKELLDRAAGNILKLAEKCSTDKQDAKADLKKNAALSCRIAMESAVLLKNDGVLPLGKNEKIIVIGEMFEKMRFQGAGSSLVNPLEVISPRDAFDNRGINYVYEKGYRWNNANPDLKLEKKALTAAAGAGTVIFFGGLSDFEESEGFDRSHMRISVSQTRLIEQLAESGKRTVLVLFAGAPVELPFFDSLSAVLDMYLPGMHGGEAAAALLFAEVCPSGKLAESWPLRAEDSSCSRDYNRGHIARYYESIYAGYRFYDKAKTKLRFPFGFGLSYTSFEYLKISTDITDKMITASIDIRNSGKYDGAEVVQLYLKNPDNSGFRPEKELRAFGRIFLKAGRKGTLSLVFGKTDLAYWNHELDRPVLENGRYEICIAASSADIRLTAALDITEGEDIRPPCSERILEAYKTPPHDIPDCFPELAGIEVPDEPEPLPLTIESPFRDFRRTFFGKILYRSVMKMVIKDYKKALKMPDSSERDARLKNSYFVVKMIPSCSLRSMCMSSSGRFSYNTARGFAALANGHFIRGIRLLLKREKPDTQQETPGGSPESSL